MGDMSWFSALSSQSGGGGGGVTDYDLLSNRPLTNLTGTGIVLSNLGTGMYNISGTWKMTDDDAERETESDDLFYVSTDGEVCKVTRVSAGQVVVMSIPVGGTVADAIVDDLAYAEVKSIDGGGAAE